MKTKKIPLIILMLLFPAFIISAQNADFSGEWKLNREKSSAANGQQLVLAKISIKLKSDSLFTNRVYENESGEYPFDENLTLDGKDCKIVIFDMPRTSKATRNADGSISISSATTFNGNYGPEDMVAKETWKVDNDGKLLTLQFTNKMSESEDTGTYYYEKAK